MGRFPQLGGWKMDEHAGELMVKAAFKLMVHDDEWWLIMLNDDDGSW